VKKIYKKYKKLSENYTLTNKVYPYK